MGAERNSGWAKMSPVRIWAGRREAPSEIGKLPGAGKPCPYKVEGASGEAKGKSRFLASLGMTFGP